MNPAFEEEIRTSLQTAYILFLIKDLFIGTRTAMVALTVTWEEDSGFRTEAWKMAPEEEILLRREEGARCYFLLAPGRRFRFLDANMIARRDDGQEVPVEMLPQEKSVMFAAENFRLVPRRKADSRGFFRLA